MNFETRRIFKSAVTSQNLIRELLQLMFIGELLSPSDERAWLVSPWISNVMLFDNRAGGFNIVNPDWGNREVRLVEVMITLMSRGTHLGICTSFDDHNENFITLIKEAADEASVSEKLVIIQRQRLHTKGVLLKRGLLTGSMNLTYYGLELNEEQVVYDSAPTHLAQARLNFESYIEVN
jgi:phosphatidylserine/phosphatidylglycerophosphate/cardiolipin synthase-like enzyme